MNERITFRLPRDLYDLLKDEAAKLGIGASVLIRQWVENSLIEPPKKPSGADGEKSSDCKIQEEVKSLHFLIQENNLLLRKIARYTNTQIVIETDSSSNIYEKKSDGSYGKDENIFGIFLFHCHCFFRDLELLDLLQLRNLDSRNVNAGSREHVFHPIAISHRHEKFFLGCFPGRWDCVSLQ